MLKKKYMCICTKRGISIFTETLFIISKSEKQPKCPSAEDRINSVHLFNRPL